MSATATSGTFQDFVREHVPQGGAEAGKQAYFLAVQLVYDNGFSVDAKRTFPQMRVDYSMLSLNCWAQRLTVWFNLLTQAERRLFLNSELIWTEGEQ